MSHAPDHPRPDSHGQDYFDALAGTWDDDPVRLARSRRVAALIAEHVPLDGVRDALEYGCGTGQVTWALANRLPADAAITLADASPGMLDVLAQRAAALPASERPRLTPRRLDLTAEALPDGCLDLAYAAMSLHHVLDVPLALRRLHAALRPGGHLAIADLDADPQHHFHGDDFAGHHGFDRDALAAELVAAGFAAPEYTEVTTLTKHLAGADRRFGVFLAVARRP